MHEALPTMPLTVRSAPPAVRAGILSLSATNRAHPSCSSGPARPTVSRPRGIRLLASPARPTAAATVPASNGPIPAGMPETYRKLVAYGCGESFREVARMVDVPSRPVGAEEVVVRVAYAGINGGCETFRVRGDHAFAFLRGREGFDLGAEGCGVVVAVGSQVPPTVATVGDAVTFAGGAFSEYAYVRSSSVFRIKECSPEAVALSLSAVTACVGIEVTGQCRAGQTVLVTAAAGGTGHFAAQLAVLAGARVFATCGSEEKARRLRALGVHRVIVHSEEEVQRVLREECPGGVDLAYEGVGGDMLRAAVENLAEGGLVMVVGYISKYPHAATEERRLTKRMTKAMAGGKGTGGGGGGSGGGVKGGSEGGSAGASGSAGGSPSTLAHTPPSTPAPAPPRTRGVCVGGWELPTEEEIFWGRMKLNDNKQGRRVVGDVYHCGPEERRRCKERVFALWEEGRLEAWVDGRAFVGLEAVPDAVDPMLSGSTIGKVVVKIGNAD